MGIYVRDVRKPSGVYFWLVESHREGKKVVQKRLKYLGRVKPTGEELERLMLYFQNNAKREGDK